MLFLRRKLVFCASVLWLTMPLTSTAKSAADSSLRLVIIFDDSGSMQGQKIELARKATHELLNSLSQAEKVVNIESVSLIPLNVSLGARSASVDKAAVVSTSQGVLTERSPYPFLKKWVNEDTTDGYFLEASGDTPLVETIQRSERG